MQLTYGLNTRHLRGDFFGGLTAAIVALPLALAFGVAAGAGPVAGLYGAICVGFFAALFGGTPAQVSGPTGPMTVVMAAVFTHYTSLDPQTGPALAFTVVMLSGLFQILFGLFRLGQFITLMPFPVISGFMNGIGTIIILMQLPAFFGGEKQPDVLAVLQHLPDLLVQAQPITVALGVMTLALLFGMPKGWQRWLPAPLLALLLGTFCVWQLNLTVDVIGPIPSGLPSFHWPTISLPLLSDMLVSALMLATLGAIDSLLTSLVADNLTKTQHRSERELVGQGLGNLLAGLVGGLPGAGATMRTVINIRSGGRTPLSGMLHSLVLLLVVLGAGSAAAQIPLAVLAGLLIKVGLDIIDWRFLCRLHRAPVFVIVLMLTVWALTVSVDLIVAVGVGVFLANIYTVKRLTDTQVQTLRVIQHNPSEHINLSPAESTLLQNAQGRVLLYQLNGPLSYAVAKSLSNKLVAYQGYQVLVLDFSNVPHMDVSTALALEDVVVDAHLAARQVLFCGVTADVERLLSKLQVAAQVPVQYHFSDRLAALQAAQQLGAQVD